MQHPTKRTNTSPTTAYTSTKNGLHKGSPLYECGRKFNRWFDMIWMEKIVE